ncbi:MAG: sensor histidine kinase [Bacteroidota bacterium]
MKRIILFFPVYFCCISFIAAQNPADSIQLYSKVLSDSVSINKLLNYCFEHINEIPDLAYSNSEIALAKSKELNLSYCQARAMTNLGAIQALKGNYSTALKFYLDCLTIWEKINNQQGIMLSKNNIAQVYGYLKKTELEYQFLKEAEQIAIKNGFQDNLGLIKLNLSIYYSNKGDYRNAFKEQSISNEINLKLNKLSIATLGFSNAGAYLFYLNKIDSAIIYYRHSENIAIKINDKKGIAVSSANIAEAFQNTGNIDSAIYYYNRSINIAQAIGLKDILAFSYEQLALIYRKIGDYNKAFQYTDLKQLIKDSIINSTATKQLAEMQIKYETEKKEKKIDQQKFEISKRNYWIGGLSISFILISLLVYSFNHRNQLKKEAQNQLRLRKSEEQATKAVLEAEENERIRIASDLHDGIGQMMSVAKMNLSAIEDEIPFLNIDQKNKYLNAIALVDDSCKEVRIISHNMMPNALIKTGLANAVRKFLDDLHNRSIKINLYTEGLNERIDSNTEIILYRIIQETVANVFKHAHANILDITLIKEPLSINIVIEDNGKGFDLSQAKSKDGIGLKNIESRVIFLKGTIEWDSKIGKGTVVVINIPC